MKKIASIERHFYICVGFVKPLLSRFTKSVLCFNQPMVRTLLLHKLAVISFFNNLAVIQHNDMIGMTDR